MTRPASLTQAQKAPGIASAEGGLVILDGPAAIAVTMTPEAAIGTGESLIAAAAIALAQSAEDGE